MTNFEELMIYFPIMFKVFYIILIGIGINLIKTLMDYYHYKEDSEYKLRISKYDLLVTVLLGFALGQGTFFMGVISDISDTYGNLYGNRIVILDIIALVSFIVQLFFHYRISSLEAKRKLGK